ncbi:MAG: 30S ribosomal protein S4e [Candidatus Nanoarchaeia archaeon]
MSKQKHLSRLAAPKSWPIVRKSTKWIAKPVPGPHSEKFAMPLIVWLREILGIVRNKSEAKKVLSQILINGKPSKELRFPVGLFDTLSIPKLDKHYRVVLNSKGILNLIEIPFSEANLILTKVVKKTTLKKGKTQVTFSNGWNLLTGPKDYALGDSALFDINKKTITRIPLKEGQLCYVFKGAHIGALGKVKEFVREGLKQYVILEHEAGIIKVPRDAIFVVGEEKPVISVKK